MGLVRAGIGQALEQFCKTFVLTINRERLVAFAVRDKDDAVVYAQLARVRDALGATARPPPWRLWALHETWIFAMCEARRGGRRKGEGSMEGGGRVERM